MCRAWSGRETHFDARGTRFRIRMPLTLKTRHGPVRYKEVNGIQGHGTATGPIKVDSRDSHNDMIGAASTRDHDCALGETDLTSEIE